MGTGSAWISSSASTVWGHRTQVSFAACIAHWSLCCVETSCQSQFPASQQCAPLAALLEECRSPETREPQGPTRGFSSCPSWVPARGGVAGYWPDATGSLPWLTQLHTARGNYRALRRKGRRAREAAFNFPQLLVQFVLLGPALHMVSLLLSHMTNRLHALEAPRTKSRGSPKPPNPSYTVLSQHSSYSVFFLSTIKMLEKLKQWFFYFG